MRCFSVKQGKRMLVLGTVLWTRCWRSEYCQGWHSREARFNLLFCRLRALYCHFPSSNFPFLDWFYQEQLGILQKGISCNVMKNTNKTNSIRDTLSLESSTKYNIHLAAPLFRYAFSRKWMHIFICTYIFAVTLASFCSHSSSTALGSSSHDSAKGILRTSATASHDRWGLL